jgi:NADPH-dependent 2,4-dienoyl-CoA reductase/sulfur reductase-like enzyme
MVAINRRLFLHSLIGASCLLSPRRVVSASKRKVVVIGGGVGGLSAVWVLAKDYPNIDVTIIEPNWTYTTCFSSSAYLAEFKNKAELNFSYKTVEKLENVKLLQASASQIDVDTSVVRLSTGDCVPYDRLIVSPGIDFQFDAIDGYSKAAMSVFPQAYDLGARIGLLKERLEAVDDGALIIISSPDRPYRCTPAPYERASMIAHYLKSHKPKSKILILDSKDEFPLMDRIIPTWERFYDGMIEWVPAEFGGRLSSVDVVDGSLNADGEKFFPALANIIPPQRASDIAKRSGLVNKSGWCPVDAITLESKLLPNIHVVGDAIDAGDMPKSAHSAMSQGAVCAASVGSLLSNQAPIVPVYENACYFLMAQDHGLAIGGSYTPIDGRISGIKGFSSTVGEADDVRKVTSVDGAKWFRQTTYNLFG